MLFHKQIIEKRPTRYHLSGNGDFLKIIFKKAKLRSRLHIKIWDNFKILKPNFESNSILEIN